DAARGGALLGRCPPDQDLRGHLGNPAQDHLRPASGEGPMTDIANPPAGTFLEDFAPGQLWRHFRGKTVTDLDVMFLAQMTMNTAEGHFHADAMKKQRFGQPIAYGGVTASIVVGLASEDTAENAVAELGMGKLRLRVPVVAGDTLY